MENKIETYLPLYIGCEVFGTYNDASGSKGILTGVTNGATECEIQFFLEDGINVEEEPTWNESKKVKPILRRLNSITEEEAKEFICSTDEGLNIISIKKVGIEYVTDQTDEGREYIFFSSIDASRFMWLLYKGFDLFGLIDSNLAIDRDTLTPQQTLKGI